MNPEQTCNPTDVPVGVAIDCVHDDHWPLWLVSLQDREIARKYSHVWTLVAKINKAIELFDDQPIITLAARIVTELQCSVCGRAWEVYADDETLPQCAYCGALVEDAK